MSSKSATVLVMLVVASIAFCLASCFAVMTGPISILPMESDSANTSDNLSTVSVDSGNDDDYYYQDYNDYSESSYSGYDVETTTADNSNPSNGDGGSSNPSPNDGGGDSDSSKVETTSG